MGIRIANVVFDAPASTLEVFRSSAGAVAAMYASLLGMDLRSRADLHREAGYPADAGDEADPLVLSDDPDRPNLAFEWETGAYHPPRWPDPAHPQQVHLDVRVHDVAAAHDLVMSHGATLLEGGADHSVYADAIGHPFCLFGGGPPGPGRIERIVFDCFSPRSLAAFYDLLLDLPERIVDEPERVEVARADGGGVHLAFQHTVADPPRWPDPDRPQQLHLDLAPDDERAASVLASALGAVRLPYLGGGFVWADPAGHSFCLGE